MKCGRSRDSLPGVSSDEETVKDADDGAKGPDSIEDAMAEAVASMERREQGDDEEGVSIEVESGDAPKASASDAVTEALITAKKELEGVLEQTQKEAGHLREKWLRAAADLENYKKRASRERDDVMKFGNEKLLKDFLPLIDDIERAVEAVEKAGTNESGGLLDGVKLVHKKFLSQLERHGVTTFESKGEPFDPNRHEAVQQMHADAPQGEVFEVLQRGFMLSDRLLRPAMVVVSLGPAAGKEGSDAE